MTAINGKPIHDGNELLDKVTARVSVLRATVGQPASFGTLSIDVRACNARPVGEVPDAAAWMEITDSLRPDAPAGLSSILMDLNAAGSILDFVLGGILHRFPGLVLAYSESNVGWMPYIFDRMDRMWSERGRTGSWGMPLPELPSSYLPDCASKRSAAHGAPKRCVGIITPASPSRNSASL